MNNACGEAGHAEGRCGNAACMQREKSGLHGMPDYTVEQKAAAFDALWRHAGNGPGELLDYVNLPLGRASWNPDGPEGEMYRRVPRYKFAILFEGEASRFRDVLHFLAAHSNAKSPDVS